MSRRHYTIALLAAACSALIVPSTALTREPPNQNDPCSTAGRNTCGTNGTGFYKNYRYGIRWFGDFRGAVDGEGPTFCIDLRWWYPAARYDFAQVSSSGLRNSNGRTISASQQARMAYGLWNFGRSNNRNQQAATMLFVHSIMGDGAPGEVDPSALNPQVVSIFNRMSRDSSRYRGPYTIRTTITPGLTIGTPGSATIRLISATGAAVPNVGFSLAGTGAADVPSKVRANSSGVARVTFTPNDVAAGVKLNVTSGAVASNAPKIYRATVRAAARNGQRMAAPDQQRLTADVAGAVAPGTITVTTKATPADILLSESVRDNVTLKGLPRGVVRNITVNVYGPFASQAAIACTGTPVNTSVIGPDRSGTYDTAPFTPPAPGWYQYQLVVPGDANISGVTTPCTDTAERFRVRVAPRVRTIVSTSTLRPGGSLFDRIQVDGLGGQAVTVNAALYGPFPSREAIKCDTPPVWSGTVPFTADGEQPTATTTITVPGYYTYRETIAESDLVRPVETLCADVAETAIVVGAPQVRTQVSAAETKPGSTISDTVVITGLGVVSATVQVELWGPYDTVAAINCSGTPYATQTFTANGDGTYVTEPIAIDRAGYFTYRESLAGGPASDAATTACGEATETTLSRPGPNVTTLASSEVILPGGAIYDNVSVTGLGKTPATVEVSLYGPFASRAAIRCDGTPVWTGQLSVPGDGTFKSPSTRLPKAGLYVFREKLLASGLVPEVLGKCGLAAETALVRPLVLTGKGDPATTAVTTGSVNPAPTKVEISALRMSAPVQSVGIDLSKGALAVPVNIRRLGWWRDGSAPGDANGSVLIGGHVDSAASGAGAFVNLRKAKVGMRVRVTTSDGRARTYRITSVRRLLKKNLPASAWSQRGRARLVLVTCGGPFIRSEGSYRDNIVVTALPA